MTAQKKLRTDISLDHGWRTIATRNDQLLDTGLFRIAVNDKSWSIVDVPHNWDAYDGYRRLQHGNRHGDSWYRKIFSVGQAPAGKRFFLFFEGVGSYATVYVNGQYAGSHAGGRTTFTIDITRLVKTGGAANLLAVRAWHPSNIKDLPWVCGGCSDDRGFSEGSQPMGIFRPVHLVITNDTRIEPFGVHAWSDINDREAKLFVHTGIKNYSQRNSLISITQTLKDSTGKTISTLNSKQTINSGGSITAIQENIPVQNPVLWSQQNPYLYTIVTTITENGRLIDEVKTLFGFRTINWKTASHQFLLNGQPVFINGIAEYEHLLGQSHAFTNDQILARMKWLKAAGFNAFRDAHQPHNLLYGQLCDAQGILWWSQLSAHIWYDSPAFRKQFKQSLKEWVIERRNDPSLILWGLQNESKLPEDFAKECTALIRELDPTASSQRLVTTCNGGTGTDWDVPQNWTGTYGGDPNTYADDIKKQVLIGEYGGWRTIDLHTEGGFIQNGMLSEDRMVQLMEKKIRLAESVRDSCAGQFFWLLNSHDNPGRVQGGEGAREMDRIGPVNYKGMLTAWEEPTDAFYMFRSNYADKVISPMVYIVSHTWPNRWMKPGIKDSIIVYSNCDEVELFNDINKASLGRKRKQGVGTHFQWDRVNIQYNVLYAVGYVNGKPVAKDTIVLNHLPASPGFSQLYHGATNITSPAPGYNYLYRVNCGGPSYKDQNGNIWLADKYAHTPDSIHASYDFSSSSWSNAFPGMPATFASQRRTFAPISGTRDWKLFQDFRYGRDQLRYRFNLPDGEYLVELYFIESWLGIGGSMNAERMRLFDVAVNGKKVLKDLDIWKEAGSNRALKKTVKVNVRGGVMLIDFPTIKVGQALISAIAIASLNVKHQTVQHEELIKNIHCKNCAVQSWMDIGQSQFKDDSITFNTLPANLAGADWLQFSKKIVPGSFHFSAAAPIDVYVAINKELQLPSWVKAFENTQTTIVTDENGGTDYTVYRKRFSVNSTVNGIDDDNIILAYLPVTNMQPAYDLKPVIAYKAAIVNSKKEIVNGKESVLVSSDSTTTIDWPVQTGVGDSYAITLKYYYAGSKEIKATVKLVGAGETMIQEETVRLSFTRPGKWNTITFNTTGMINAGNYLVKIFVEDAKGLALNEIDIQ